jgi:hypothetical protein
MAELVSPRPVVNIDLALEPSLSTLIPRIAADYPALEFVEGNRFSWHAGKKYISFKRAGPDGEHSMWALLHELGHALLSHTSYRYDIELLQLEASAWEKACDLATAYGIKIDDDYIQDCLDTYRDWLHMRATCPTCLSRSLQTSPQHYYCLNCHTEWSVTRSRLCRPYRLQTT